MLKADARFPFLLLMSLAAVAAAGPETRPSDPPGTQPVVLPRGKAEGTFRLSFRSRITFSMGTCFPAKVSISAPLNQTVATMDINDGKPFTIEADLQPGSYTIWSTLTSPEAAADYQEETYVAIFIDRDGRLHYPHGDGKKVLVHFRRIVGMSPSKGEIADKAKPTLKWKPVEGAVRYACMLRGGTSGRFDVTEPTYTLPNAVKAGEPTIWQLLAYAPDGRVLASNSAGFYGFGTDPEFVRQQNEAVCPLPRLPDGPGFLGARFMGMSTARDVANMSVHVEKDGRRWTTINGPMTPAIMLTDLLPGSPAVAAGLREGDLIVAVDGRPIASDQDGYADTAAFRGVIGGTKPGTALMFKVRREATDLEIPVTIGSVPASLPNPSTAPATTQPASDDN